MLQTSIISRRKISPGRPNAVGKAVDDQVRRRLTECPYAFIFSRITWQFADERLTLRGSVPSFYLKQMLQEQLRGIDDVERIINDVAVVSATGLSSEPRGNY